MSLIYITLLSTAVERTLIVMVCVLDLQGDTIREGEHTHTRSKWLTNELSVM